MSDEIKDLKEDVHKLSILVEDVFDKIKIVAEGTAMFNEKFDRRIDELEEKLGERIDDTQKMMGIMHKELDNKIDETAQSLDNKIDETAQRLDNKIDESKKELKADILRVESRVIIIDEKLETHEKVMHHH